MEAKSEKMFPDHLKTRSDRLAWLVENKDLILTKKKSAVKHSDALSCSVAFVNERGHAMKSLDTLGVEPAKVERIKVRVVVNTTKLLDSHMDVHIDQLWNKSLKENRRHYLVREHQLTFDGIISDDVHAFVKQMTWEELGFSYPGYTQALIYDAVIDAKENPYMFDKYLKGKVRNHSVGMRYVKVHLAVNDERYPEYENWEKYFPLIVNPEEALEQGYFFAVTEAKNIEGSAVVVGSNFATPTISVEEKSEPARTTRMEPMRITPKELLKYYQPRIKI